MKNMAHTNTGRYILAIVVIGISSLIVLSLFSKHPSILPASRAPENPEVKVPIEVPVVDFTDAQDQPVKKPAPKAEPKVESPAPAPLQNNQVDPKPEETQPTTIVNITTSPTTVIVNTPAPETPQAPMPTSAKTYNITKGTEPFKQNLTEAEVREFAGSLNNYVKWKKQMKEADLEIVFGALSSNGYAVQENDPQ